MTQDVKKIDAATAKKWLESNEAVLLDVREQAEYDSGHVAGAVHLPLGQVCVSALNIPSDKKIIVHCKLGMRSDMACEKLLKENAGLDLYNMSGGIDAWTQHGFSVEVGTAHFSVDRQIQVVEGGLVILGVLFGLLVHPIFFLLAVLTGAVSLYSGLKGSCLVTMLFTRLPWNR